MSNKSAFWIVWSDYKSAPGIHNSFVSAEIRAEQLAREEPGVDFFVLKAQARFRSINPVEKVDLFEVKP